MESPKKYVGYDENWEFVTVIWARKATNDIDPEVVETRINNVDNVLNEQITLIQEALRDLTTDASKAIVVNKIDTGKQIEELADALETLKNKAWEALGDIYDASVSEHDRLQEGYNEDARNRVWATEGVEHVQ